MALQNADELADVLDGAAHLGPVFARHAYGMRAWVDLFSARLADLPDPDDKALLATLVAINARHMLLFRARAAANGTDPDAYACPDEGEAIYERIPGLDGADELVGYALGSLDHFAELLAVYRAAADGPDAGAIDTVRADVDQARATLRARASAGAADAQALAAEAHELYRVRELAEVPRYAHAA
jgi:hypothetical protein